MVYSAIPLGSSLMCFRFLQVAWGFWQTGELPHHDHAHVEGVEATPPPLVGETFADGEEIEHAHMGRSDKDWENAHPHKPSANDDKGA
jgi:C4-dicarboxylate transporter DctQ subunit